MEKIKAGQAIEKSLSAVAVTAGSKEKRVFDSLFSFLGPVWLLDRAHRRRKAHVYDDGTSSGIATAVESQLGKMVGVSERRPALFRPADADGVSRPEVARLRASPYRRAARRAGPDFGRFCAADGGTRRAPADEGPQ